jgi:hypothetical protein
MDIEFTPVFEITVTPEEVALHYARNGITDYPKTNSGLPNMKTNKTVCKLIYAEKRDALIAKYQGMVERRKETLAETSMLRAAAITEDCPICLDPISGGRSILNCSHTFCIQCSIEHFRANQRCPLCRAEVCGPAKKVGIVPISDEAVEVIVENNVQLVYPERHQFDLYNFILTSAVLFRNSEHSDAFTFADEIFEEIRRFGHDVASNVKDWYEN